MNKFKENKISTLLSYIALFFCIVSFIGLIGMAFEYLFGVLFFGGIIITAFFLLVSNFFSIQNNFTIDFISEIKTKLKQSVTLEDHIEINDTFERIAIFNDIYILSFPQSIRKLHNEILNKIEILEKQENVS